MNKVYVVTHGTKRTGANPDMAPEGYLQVALLREYLPPKPSRVVCGTGKRHLAVAFASDLTPTMYSAVVGGPESLEILDGVETTVLADGTTFPYAIDTTERYGGPSAAHLVLDQPDNTVITTGRAIIVMLGVPLGEAKSAAVYVIEHDGGIIGGIKLLCDYKSLTAK